MALIPALVLLLLWIVGVPVRYLAIFFVAALVIEAVTSRRAIRFGKYSPFTVWVIIAAWSALVFGVEVFRLFTGDQGVEFAIFTQAMGEFASNGRFQTSLIGTGWSHFLTHNLAPLLVVPGFVARLGADVQLVAIAFHAAAIGAALFAIAALGRLRGLSLGVITICCTALILHPGLRIPSLWEIHDEVYAAPFVLFGILLLERGRVALALLSLALASLCKETMLLVAFGCCSGALTAELLRARAGFCEHLGFFNWRQKLAVGLGAVAFLLGFFLYPQIVPSKLYASGAFSAAWVMGASELMNPTLWSMKAWCAFTWIIFPTLTCISLYRCGRFGIALPRAFGAALGALSYQLAVLVLTNSEAQLNPYNYYQILPVMLVGVVLMAVVPRVHSYRPALVGACLCLSFCFGSSHGPLDSLPEAKKIAAEIREIDGVLPSKSVVVASDWDTSWLVGDRHVIRTYHANRSIVRFDYIVQRRGRRDPLARYLRSWSRPCFKNTRYAVRCALPSAAADPQLARNFPNYRVKMVHLRSGLKG